MLHCFISYLLIIYHLQHSKKDLRLAYNIKMHTNDIVQFKRKYQSIPIKTRANVSENL